MPARKKDGREEPSGFTPLEDAPHLSSVSTADQQIRQIIVHLESGSVLEAAKELSSLHPADQAQVVRTAPPAIRQPLIPLISAPEWAAILEHLDSGDAADALQGLETTMLIQLVDEVRPDVAAGVLRLMPRELAEVVLATAVRAPEITPLMAYPDESAGGLMNPLTVTVSEDTTIAQVMALLRQNPPFPQERYSYFVVDGSARLLGTVSLQTLVFSEPERLIHDVMSPVVAQVAPDVDQEECTRIMRRYGVVELPVVAAAGKLLGVIALQQAFDVAEEEATEDMYRLGGLGAAEHLGSPLGRSLLRRLPWLLLNLATVVLAASVIAIFESTIARLIALAAFLPVVAGQGGAAGTQTLTLMVRSIALGEISFRSARRLIFRELLLGAINGVILGILIGCVGLLWEDSPVLGLALLAAMVANMMVAALAGAVIPLGLRAINLDPALASVVLVTTLTDLVGFAVYLGTATALLWYF